jgi:alpha-L-rhamnosidase
MSPSAPVGDVTWAKASYHSIRGKIVSDWKRDGGMLTLKVTIPANTTATVLFLQNPLAM